MTLIEDLTCPRSVVAHSKAVLGVTFDPFHDDRLCTFSEDGIVKLWDLTNLSAPIFSFDTDSKNLVQVAWCPTRKGMLSTISRDEKVVKIWDIKDTTPELVSEELKLRVGLNKPCRSTWHMQCFV